MAELVRDDHNAVCFYVFFPKGGIGRYTHQLMSELNRFEDVSVEVACPPDYLWVDALEYETWPGLMSVSHAVPVLRRSKFVGAQFVNPARFIRRAVQKRVRIAHFSNINHLTYRFWRQRFKSSQLAIVATVHDVRRQKSIVNQSWEDGSLREFYKEADALFVHSRYQESDLIDYADVDPEKVVIVPHGVYPHAETVLTGLEARKVLGLNPREETALFFGQIRDEKNLEVLIRCMAFSSRPWRLVIAGKGEGGHHHSAAHYVNLARKLGVLERIDFIARYIEEEEVGLLFKACDWVALPYLDSFTSQSGVLNVAMNYDRPVLVSSSPVLAETVRSVDIGVVCSGDSVAAIGEGIEIMSRRCASSDEFEFSTYHEKYSWAENARITRDVYRKLSSRT